MKRFLQEDSGLVAAWALLGLLVLLLGLTSLHAQTAVLMPMPVIQFSDANGNPLAGGYVYTYEAGTSINQATYTDSTGTTVNTDPVVLNAAGEPSSPLGPGFAGGIYLINGANYRVCVYSYLSVQQWCADNIELNQGAQTGSSSNTQVLYNCAGSICGSTGLTYNAGTQDLSVTELSVSSGGSLAGTFTGSPTISNLTVPGVLTVGTFNATTLSSSSSANCPTAQAAATGFLRLCNTDKINWRNAANSGDEGLADSTGDVLLVSMAGGLAVTGTIPGIAFGGTTSSYPAWLGTGTVIRAVLADGSAPAQVQLNGVTLPTNTPTGPGQVLTTTSTTAADWQTPSTVLAILQASTTMLASSVTVPANSATTWLSKTITLPSSGCPCRVFASYGAYFTTSNTGVTVAWVSETSSGLFATAQHDGTGSESAGGINASAYSTGPAYANGVTVTFNAVIETSASGGLTVNVTNNSGSAGSEASWLNLAVLPSN